MSVTVNLTWWISPNPICPAICSPFVHVSVRPYYRSLGGRFEVGFQAPDWRLAEGSCQERKGQGQKSCAANQGRADRYPRGDHADDRTTDDLAQRVCLAVDREQRRPVGRIQRPVEPCPLHRREHVCHHTGNPDQSDGPGAPRFALGKALSPQVLRNLPPHLECSTS